MEERNIWEIGDKVYIKMTRQGIKFHIHKLEKQNKIERIGFTGRKNIVYQGVKIC